MPNAYRDVPLVTGDTFDLKAGEGMTHYFDLLALVTAIFEFTEAHCLREKIFRCQATTTDTGLAATLTARCLVASGLLRLPAAEHREYEFPTPPERLPSSSMPSELLYGFGTVIVKLGERTDVAIKWHDRVISGEMTLDESRGFAVNFMTLIQGVVVACMQKAALRGTQWHSYAFYWTTSLTYTFAALDLWNVRTCDKPGLSSVAEAKFHALIAQAMVVIRSQDGLCPVGRYENPVAERALFADTLYGFPPRVFITPYHYIRLERSASTQLGLTEDTDDPNSTALLLLPFGPGFDRGFRLIKPLEHLICGILLISESQQKIIDAVTEHLAPTLALTLVDSLMRLPRLTGAPEYVIRRQKVRGTEMPAVIPFPRLDRLFRVSLGSHYDFSVDEETLQLDEADHPAAMLWGVFGFIFYMASFSVLRTVPGLPLTVPWIEKATAGLFHSLVTAGLFDVSDELIMEAWRFIMEAWRFEEKQLGSVLN